MIGGPTLRLRAGLMAVAVTAVLAAAPSAAQVPPDAEWATRTTSRFRVSYPAHLSDLGARVAVRAEAAYELLSGAFETSPDGPVDILVADHRDAANGFARLLPDNHIIVVSPPPTDGLSLAWFDDWLDLVLVHELAHLFHMDEPGTPGTIVRSVMGRIPAPWPTFPGLATPEWTREGIATYYESALTGAGRARGTFFDMILRTAVLEDAFEELDQASGRSPVWPAGNRPYVYGSRFFAHLVDRHGEEKVDAFVRAFADQWIPYRLNPAAEEAFGVGFDEAWERWREELAAEAGELRDSLRALAPLTRPETLARHGRYALRPAPDAGGQRIAYARSDGRTDAQIHLLDPDGADGEKLVRTNGLSDFSWTPDGAIVFAQLEFTDRYRRRSDLYRADRSGRVERITEGARLDQPHVGPEGREAVAVQTRGGTRRLVEIELASGEVSPLTSFHPEVHWAYPRISPDGRWVAAARWSSGGLVDVVLLDREGRLRHEVTRDRAVDLAPAWSPDGRWLVWASDRTGIWNVLAVAVGEDGVPGPPRQLTNMVTGATYPAVGPGARWLYFSGYHADGWRVERIPFDPDGAPEPFPPDPRFADRSVGGPVASAGPRSTVADVRGDTVPGTAGPYSPAATLGPRYWLPAFRPAEDAAVEDGPSARVLDPAFGVRTSGRDVVERHAWGVEAMLSGSGRFRGGASYRYAGLGNPVVGVTLRQDHDAGPRGIVAESEDTTELLFPAERERSAELSTTFVRRRYRDVLFLELGGAFFQEHHTLLTRDREPSRAFRPVRPDRRFVQARALVGGDRVRVHPFSVSPEDGVRALVRFRARRETSLPDSLAGVAGFDRSFVDGVAVGRAYKSVPGPGFANHVLSLRVAGGAAGGPGADAFHYEVGGASGRPEPITGLQLFGGGPLLFPVRGLPAGARFGRVAWSGSVEYRFPLLLAHRGLGMFPLYVDRISGSLFGDAGNAWGPRLGTGSSRYDNPRRPAVASAGAEVAVSVLPFWTTPLTFRTGVALPLRGAEAASVYVRLGLSF